MRHQTHQGASGLLLRRRIPGTAMLLATAILVILGVYASVGIVFSVAFAWRGAGAIDPVARSAGWGFRLLVIPGAAALWPWLLVRWRAAGRGTEIGS